MSNNKKRILIVDDSPLSRHLILNELKRCDEYELYEAENGQEALEKIVEIKPRLVTMDIEMPGIDGFETCRRIREIDSCRSIPIIIITNHDCYYTREKGFNAGVVHFFNKNFKPNQLKTYMENYLFNEAKERDEKVLVYDRSPNVLINIEYLLMNQGFKVDVYDEIDSLYSEFDFSPYSLMILDMDSYNDEVLEIVKLIKKMNPSVPIIITISKNERNVLLEAFKVGIHDYLIKPFYSDEFIYRMNSHINYFTSKLVVEKQNKELEEKITHQKKFYAFLSHDIRGPIINTIGFLKLILNGNLDKMEAIKELASKFIHKEESLLLTLDQLLDYIRFDLKGGDIRLNKLNFVQLLKDVLEQYNISVTKKKLVIFNNFEFDELWIWGDITLLRQAVSNILSNAVKFSKPEGTICFNIETNPIEMFFSIKDEGIGFDEKDHKHLFMEFYSKGYNQIGEKGFGIGLSVVKKIVESHHGSVFAYSKKGRGADVGFKLPLDLKRG